MASASRTTVHKRGAKVPWLSLYAFLASVAAFTFGVYWSDSALENQALQQRITELEASQLLLVVPEEQAAALARWVETNPQLEQVIAQARQAPEDDGLKGIQIRPQANGGVLITTREWDLESRADLGGAR